MGGEGRVCERGPIWPETWRKGRRERQNSSAVPCRSKNTVNRPLVAGAEECCCSSEIYAAETATVRNFKHRTKSKITFLSGVAHYAPVPCECLCLCRPGEGDHLLEWKQPGTGDGQLLEWKQPGIGDRWVAGTEATLPLEWGILPDSFTTIQKERCRSAAVIIPETSQLFRRPFDKHKAKAGDDNNTACGKVVPRTLGSPLNCDVPSCSRDKPPLRPWPDTNIHGRPFRHHEVLKIAPAGHCWL